MLKRLILVALILICACANEVDDSENILVLPKAEGACAECLKPGAWYRFTSLELKEIVGGTDTLLAALGGTWAKDITKMELNILMEVVSVNNSEVEFQLVNGARVGEGDICRLTDTEVSMVQPFEGEGLGQSKPTKVFVFAGSEAHPKNCNVEYFHAIPVANVVATTSCSGKCDPIEEDFLEGEFNGALTKAGFDTTCTCLELGDALSDDACGEFSADYTDTEFDGVCNGCGSKYKALASLVPLFNVEDGVAKELDFSSCEESAGEPAACLKASFRAYRLPEPPPACQ